MVEEQEWRPVRAGKYEVTSDGLVRSAKTKRILKQNNSSGYWRVEMCHRGRAVRENTGVHRLVADAFAPNPNFYNCVNHKDGNKLNNNADNLEWCTPAHNSQHAARMGLRDYSDIRGKRSGRALLTNQQVRDLREMRAGGSSIDMLAHLSGLTRSGLFQLLSGRTYADAGGPILAASKKGGRSWSKKRQR
jgi:hypothetical protein